MFVKSATIRLIASLDSMTYSSQSGTGEKCDSNIFTDKLAFAFTREGLHNNSGPACLESLPSCDTPFLRSLEGDGRQILRGIHQK